MSKTLFTVLWTLTSLFAQAQTTAYAPYLPQPLDSLRQQGLDSLVVYLNDFNQGGMAGQKGLPVAVFHWDEQGRIHSAVVAKLSYNQWLGQDLHVVTLIIPVPGAGGQQFPGSVFTEKGFPGTIFAGKGDALVMDWLKQGGVQLAPIAVALSQPLARQDPPQRITYAEKIPDGLNQDLGIQWPNRVGAPQTLLVPAKQLSRDLIGQQAPKGSEFAVVSLIIGKNLPEPPPVMLVFF